MGQRQGAPSRRRIYHRQHPALSVRDATPESQSYALTATDILKATAREFNIPTSELIGPRLCDDTAYIRHLAWYVTRQESKASYPNIGRAWNRHHSTVMNGVARIERDLKTDLAPVITNQIDSLTTRLDAIRQRAAGQARRLRERVS